MNEDKDALIYLADVRIDELEAENAKLHRLREVDVSDEAALKAEIERSKAVEGISHNIIEG